MNSSSGISVGLQIGTQPPLSALRTFLLGARVMRLESVMVIDHFQNVFPTVIWDRDLTWLAAQRPTPHRFSITRFCSAISLRASGGCASALG